MRRPLLVVTVTLSDFGGGGAPKVQYGSPTRGTAWATEAKVDKHGNLRIYAGFNQRVFHPVGEWTEYTVSLESTLAPPTS